MIIIDNIEYKVLFTYEMNNKKYIIYTTGKEDNEGFIKTYAGIYQNIEGKESILPLETDEEIDKINDLLTEFMKEES